MPRGFSSILKAFRVRSAAPLAYNYANNTNADLSCDSDGNLFVSIAATALTPTPGSAGTGAQDFSSQGFVTDYIPVFVAPIPLPYSYVLQHLSAHAAVPNTFLMVFSDAGVPVDGSAPLYCWPVPMTGFQFQAGFPYGLSVPTAVADALHFVFSSTPSLLTNGPLGFIQGIYSYRV